ncbi:MAG TPA: monofunctional biosynthetic peptidoglycan transglycosylase [Thermoanaerobaculia bacterium]|nr:monofunctional biosynthetic peptidoglycan transglycosylase [Thermoanaerobaculia bacterium]
MVRRILLASLAAALAGVGLFFLTLPDVTPLRASWPRSTAFIERRKQEISRAGGDPRIEWTPVPMSRISGSLARAVVVAEDSRFYEHAGVDWDAVKDAVEKNLDRGDLKVGGSTITQQLAKNLYLSPARSLWRKLREWAIARRLEGKLSKRRILEIYLNVIEFGPRTFGAEAAARRFFHKPAASLTEMEAATLAAVIPSPRIYDPVRHPDRVERRARRILRWMGKTSAQAGSGRRQTGQVLLSCLEIPNGRCQR